MQSRYIARTVLPRARRGLEYMRRSIMAKRICAWP